MKAVAIKARTEQEKLEKRVIALEAQLIKKSSGKNSS
jgi:BMFP domain-containing protein YqiC